MVNSSPSTADENAAFIDVAADVVDNFLALSELEEAAARIELNMAFPGAGEPLHAGEEPGANLPP